MTIAYQTDNKQSRKVNKFAIINCIIGIPTISLLAFLMIKGLLANYIVTSSIALSFLVLGVSYSIFKIVKEKKEARKT
ncbi:MAG: hypothetical protein KGD64_01625 [Candidatus Heimdallarchaeota archaeon]|nr:hypothetical protein [Candidatus Heimdallarchaeota archaeon]